MEGECALVCSLSVSEQEPSSMVARWESPLCLGDKADPPASLFHRLLKPWHLVGKEAVVLPLVIQAQTPKKLLPDIDIKPSATCRIQIFHLLGALLLLL